MKVRLHKIDLVDELGTGNVGGSIRPCRRWATRKLSARRSG